MAISEAERIWHSRLINASIAALQINGSTLSQSVDGYAQADFRAPPACFVGGARGINAGLLGEVDNDYAILAFRGTLARPDSQDAETICLDWTQDRNYTRQAWPIGSDGSYGKTSAGFSLAMASIWPELQAALARVMAGKRGLWITGHSKGGAMAVLAASLIGRSHPIDHIVTFGAPMVGDATFKASYTAAGLDAKTIRYQNQYDGVPLAPYVDTPPMIMEGCSALATTVPGDHEYKAVGAMRFILWSSAYQALDIVTDPFTAGIDYAASMDYAVHHQELIGPAHNPRGNYRDCFATPR